MQYNCPETDLKILTQESRSEDQDEPEAGNELSHKLEEDSLLDKSDVLESKDKALQDKEGVCPEHSDKAAKQANEHKDPPTDIEGSLKIDHTSESEAHGVPKYPETVLGDMIDQAEIISSIQPELSVKSNDGSDTKQEVLPADDQQNQGFTTEGNMKSLDETNKDDYLYDSNETSISSPVEVNTTSQVDDDRGLIGDIKHSSDNSQSQEAPGSVNELSNKEKLGSSHKSKERQQDKDFKEEVKEKFSGDETAQIPLDTQIMSQEELSLDMEHDNVLPVSHGSTLLSISAPGESLEVQNSPSKMSAGNDQESLIPANVNILQGQDKSKTDISMELSNQSLEETSGHQSNPLDSESGIHQTREVVGPYTDDDVRQSQEHEALHTQVQEPQQVDGTVDVQVEEGGVFVGDTKTNPADPRVQDNSLSADQETDAGFSFGGSRRKLGSSRRNKGRRQRKGSTEEVLEDDEMFESADTRNTVSENIVNAAHEDVNSTQIQDSLQAYSYKTVSGDAAENLKIISGTPTDQAEACELKINSIEDITTKGEASSSKEIQSDGLGLKNEETVQHDARPNINQIFHQDKEGPFREMEGNTFVLPNFQSENIVSNSQPQESPESVVEQTKEEPHSRRKLGSSRRNKGNSKAKDPTVETYNELMKAVEENASRNEPCEKRTEIRAQDQEQSMEIVPDEVVANDSPQTEDVNVGSSGCATMGIQPSSTLDQAVINTSSCAPITDRELNTPHSRDQEEYRELCIQHENSQESLLSSEPHACPPITEMHAEESSNSEHANSESREGDGFKKGLEQETEPAQNPDMLLSTEKDGGDAAGNPKANSKNLFNQTGKKSTEEDTEMLQPDKNVHKKDIFAPPERTTEKSSDVYQAQFEYSVEQCSVSSPHEMCSADGEENSHIIFQSDKDATLDSQHQDTCQSLKDDAHSGLKASGSRRKLGSSRRNKGRKHDQVTEQNQESKVEASENTGDDDATEMLAAKPAVQEELENLTLPENVATFRSAVSEKLLLENTVSSHDILEDSTIATSDLNLISKQENSVKSNAETKEKDANLIDETEDSIQLTGHDTDIKGLMQSDQATVWRGDSDMQSDLFHDGIISPGPESVHVTDQEEGLQRQNRETLSGKKEPPGAEVQLQQTNKDRETIGFVTTEDCSSEVESSMDVRNLKQEEEGEQCMFATAQQKENSNEFVSASQEPAMDAFHKGGISTTLNTLESQREKPQVTSKQKKRKIGSSRRTPMSRKREGETNVSDDTEESDFGAKADTMNVGEKGVVGEVPVNVEAIQGEDVQPQQATSTQQRTPETKTSDGLTRSNMSMDFPPEQSATIDRIKETQRPEDFTGAETQITSEIAERNGNLLNQPMSSNTDTPGVSLEFSRDLPQKTQGDEHSPENIEVRQVQDVQEQIPSSTTEGIPSQNPEIRNTSQNLTPTNRRRKMGSTRKNLATRTEQEILEAENESTDTVTSSGDGTAASVLEEKETELQLPTEHTDDTSRQGKEKETVEISPFGESLLRALAEEAAEEGPVSQKLMVEAEREQSPAWLSSSPTTSELASGGKRKKFGSNRKSGLQQRKAQQDTQPEDEAGGSTEGQVAHGEGSPGLHKISEVDENEVKAPSSASTLKAAEFSKPGRGGTPEKSLHDNIRLDQESGSQLSFGTTSGTGNSDCYNVVMIGESCVGKTSFMKRAQSGKFSLDLPASVGLDSCKWTVVVDGKPVLLQLWDTAGQERFHSITRQVFHKAQAFLLMYDITCSQSFSAVSYWANSIQEAAPEDVTVLLLGNKSDNAKRQVKTEQGDVLAKEYNFEFMECSAATGENVIEALETVARMLSQRADLLREEVTVLHREPGQRNRSKCC
uniref:Ras-related protein Rab-44 n=2 Tax=Fundulus heteroclitus TaxID=8078 RepID=A0A3Q2QQJ0_FUNHE